MKLLTPPLLSDDHIHSKLICIRPHRERIFRIEYERLNNHHLFHNYGHAGAGWTFLFGSVEQSMRQFSALNLPKTTRITVVGAGCYGLVTAIELHRAGYSVTIVADRWSDIPSEKAAGFFFPRPRRLSTPDEIAQFAAVGSATYRAYLAIEQGNHPYISSGVTRMPAYYDPLLDPGFDPYIAQGLIEPGVLTQVSFNGGKTCYDALAFTVVHIDASAIMHQLRSIVAREALSCVTASVAQLTDLDTQVVFNCSGMGAKQLAPDPRIIPVQGHLITLYNQPDLSRIRYMINVRVSGKTERGKGRNDLIYYAPKNEGILGITFLRGQDGSNEHSHEFDRLLERSRRFFAQ